MDYPRITNLNKELRTFFEREIRNSIRETQLLMKISRECEERFRSQRTLLDAEVNALNYKIGSLFLRECAEYLTSSSEEVMHLVTGLEVYPGLYIIDKMEKIKFEASIISAKADINDLFRKLVEMDETYGHLLLGVFHSHPFSGMAGTRPSGIDKKLQDVFESSGYKAIQAVFSQDGYIRFFSNKLSFEIEIYGKSIKKIGKGDNEYEYIYQLVNFQKK